MLTLTKSRKLGQGGRAVDRAARKAREPIVLNAAQSRRFAEALLAPPGRPTPSAVEAARIYRKTVKSDLD